MRLVLAAFFVLPAFADEPKKPITPAMLFTTPPSFGSGAPAITWLDAEHWLQTKNGVLHKVKARTGDSEPAFDEAAFRKSLGTIPKLDKQRADAYVRGTALRTDAARTGTLVELENNFWFAYFDGRPAQRFTDSTGKKEFATLNPQGDALAFIKGNNLFVSLLKEPGERQITSDISKDIFNARGDWVYEEEIFNRNGRAYWWSPDGKSIAYLRFDDTPVKKFTITRAFPAAGETEVFGYPKPGDPNPTVKLFVAKLDGTEPVALKLPYEPDDLIIARVGWTPQGAVYAFAQNRIQTFLDFVLWPTSESEASVLFRDKTPAWIDDPGEPRFLNDGTFLFLSERDGWKHIYHYGPRGDLIRQLTKGEFEVKEILRVDDGPAPRMVWFNTTLGSPNGNNVAGVPVKGGELVNVTAGRGTNTANLAPSGPLFVCSLSNYDSPAKSFLAERGGDMIRKMESGRSVDLSGYTVGKYERVQIPVADKQTIEAAITWPPGFDPKKKYPVWMLTYAGPHTPTIKDSYSTRMMEQVLANMGIIVFRVDPRSASGHSAKSAWGAYKQLGVQELQDLEAAVDWISKNEFVDKTRIGLSGHSFGGYITAYALTHSKKFSAGIAGAPVTDWHLYDTIYTERFMTLPKDNKEGYDKSSVVKAAKNLHGRLLIIHGLVDDNVHFQNAMQLAQALQEANKPFEIMVYPNARHGIFGRHYQELQLEFIKRTMLIRN